MDNDRITDCCIKKFKFFRHPIRYEQWLFVRHGLEGVAA